LAVGDYDKTTFVDGGPPGISADRLNNNENKTNELDKTVESHLSDYATFKTEVGSNVKILELDFLDLLIARDLESLSTDMDAGYWWDTLADATKIQSITGASVSGGKIITTADTSEVTWKGHDVGFLTNKVTFYQKRTKTSDIAPVDASATAGDSLLSVKAATITIS